MILGISKRYAKSEFQTFEIELGNRHSKRANYRTSSNIVAALEIIIKFMIFVTSFVPFYAVCPMTSISFSILIHSLKLVYFTYCGSFHTLCSLHDIVYDNCFHDQQIT